MGEIQEDRMDEQFYRDANWVAGQGWIHSNNVLFYFAESPFFDRTSNNNSLIVQAMYNQSFAAVLGTRDLFEKRLSTMSGLEFVVAHDPLQSNVRISNPNGETEPSNVWVIKKQDRRKRQGMPDEVTVLAYYYIVNEAIFMAPSIARVVGNRILSTVTSLNRMLSAATPLPMFSPARGHSYLPPASKSTANATTGQPSKENTPMPDTQTSALSKAAKVAESVNSTEFQDLRTLTESFKLSRHYGKEYMDDLPLVGEPGNFILSKSKNDDLLAAPPGIGSQSNKSPLTAVKESSKTPSAAPTPVPHPIQTDVPFATSKKLAKSASGDKTPTSTKDRKRRKSKPAISMSAG